MKFFIRTYLLTIIFFILFQNIFAQKEANISGTILNNNGFSKIYLFSFSSYQFVDSANISDKGDFNLKLKLEKIDYFQLYLNQDNHIVVVLLPGDNVNIKYDLNDKNKPMITGSQNTQLYYNSYTDLNNYDKQNEEFSAKIAKDKKDYIRKMINNNSNSFSCLFFIYQLDIKEDLEYYKKLVDGLQQYKGNNLLDELERKVKSESAINIGSEAPEIDMPSINGKNIKLSSLRGNIVLIDFWASWCKPCRMENPELIKLYKEFHKKGFEIYSVSLDQDKSSWENAIKKDSTGAWVHVSDLKYWNSAAAALYGVQAIPFTVLIDKKGKIIAKGLRGKEIEQKLVEILK